MQTHYGGIQKNTVLLNENIKITSTVKKPRRFTNTYTDQFLGNISSTDNDSDDSDGERSDSNIYILTD